MALTFGFPRMNKEPGEKRDFLPDVVAFLDRLGAKNIVIQQGLGSGMGLRDSDYLMKSARVRVGTVEDCFDQDVVVVLRYPSDPFIQKLRRGSVLVSMVHLPTRPGRVAMLSELGIRAVSLDSIVDDTGRRLVENLEAVGWGGLRSAFVELKRTWPELESPKRRPVRVLVLGAGAVGSHAVRAAACYGDRTWRAALTAKGVPGVETTVVDYDLTGDEAYLRGLMKQADIVVDATYRPDPSKPVVPNAWLADLPPHAVVVDLSVDPYDFTRDPPQVKGIEGLPEGNLDQYAFTPDDLAWAKLDSHVDTRVRRTALSCYSWPGILPRECMEKYGAQLEPVLRVLVEKGVERLDVHNGTFFERAVARAEVMRWRQAHPR